MKYWKEKEINPVEKMDFWKGDYITKLEPNEVFVFGANPQARHFAGAAKAALSFGAVPINIKQNKPGIARGLSPNNKTYALITKSLEAGYTEAETGITYHKEGFQSVSVEQIRANVDQLYETAKKPEHLDKKFLITYQYEAWPNGTPKKSLNGYTSQEMLEMFAKDKEIPPNIIFHETYKPYLEKLFKKENKQSTGKLVVYENDKTIDIKEEDIIWTIVEDERNPEGRHGAGAAKAAMGFKNGAKYGIGRGLVGCTFAVITKNLTANYLEKKTGILYKKEGYLSVSEQQIRENIKELYDTARAMPEKSFLISYQLETWPNGTPKKSLNGYTSKEILDMFVKDQDVPNNIVFHDSYQPHIEKLLTNKSISTAKSEEKKLIKNTLLNETNSKNILSNLIVISPHDSVPEGFTVINTTSQDKNIGIQFSPFYLKDIPLYEGKIAKNMENAWQFSKVYKEFADENGNPSDKYFEWANKGWNDSFAHRYANGKGNIPLYSYWKTYENGQWKEHQYDYVTARKNIYFPLYAKAIINSQAFKDLEQRVNNGEKIALWDFDGYNHEKRNMTYEDVVNSDKYKCGHAFVLYGLLTKQLKIINNELVYDFNLKIEEKQNMQNENTKKEYTFFFHLTSPFSNFHPSKFEYKDLTFISNEQFMMYSKAKTFKDEVTAKKIIEMNNTPLIKDFIDGKISREDIINDKVKADQWNKLMMKIKGFGKEVSPYNDEVWSNRRAKVVLFGAREKFSQNEDLKQILMNTGDTYMVEASPYDKIWGIGLSSGDAKRIPEDKWPGLNLLGKVLNALKTEFKAQLVNKGDNLPRKKF